MRREYMGNVHDKSPASQSFIPPAQGTNGTGVSPEEVKVVGLNRLASWLNFRGILEYALKPLVAPVELAHRAAASVRTCSLMRECEAKPVLSSRWAPEPEVVVGYMVKTTAHQSALCLAEGWVQNGAGWMHLVSL
ncbi:unnamed protein product [Boreogadus saida]